MKHLRNRYEQFGVQGYYSEQGDKYENPHEPIIAALLNIAREKYNLGSSILDLCCGSGEVTMALNDLDVTGCDPYTYELYEKRTGRQALRLSFKDIATQGIPVHYDTTVCSFALHLSPPSLLPTVLYKLRSSTTQLIIITPHKRPDCDGVSGWHLVDEIKHERVRMRVYM